MVSFSSVISVLGDVYRFDLDLESSYWNVP
jgi:hypothetical protein